MHANFGHKDSAASYKHKFATTTSIRKQLCYLLTSSRATI